MSSLIDSIRAFVLACPFLRGGRVNVDYIGEEMGYSVDPLPCDPIVQRYTDGGAKKQFQFAFTSQEDYDQDARINIENSGFFQAFDEWIEGQSQAGNFPALEDDKIPILMETLNSGYLYDINGIKAKYRIECRLVYAQEA